MLVYTLPDSSHAALMQSEKKFSESQCPAICMSIILVWNAVTKEAIDY